MGTWTKVSPKADPGAIDDSDVILVFFILHPDMACVLSLVYCQNLSKHLPTLLACTDADVIEACLQTLAAFLKKMVGKYMIRDAILNSKLCALAQGWGGKDEVLGLISCAVKDNCDPVTHELGYTPHFEFYALNDLTSEDAQRQGLQKIHIPDVSNQTETDLELLSKLVAKYKVPTSLRFSLLTSLCFARAFSSLEARQQYACIRLYAFKNLVQAAGDAEQLASFFKTDLEFVNELVLLLSYGDAVPEKIRIMCLLSLVDLCHERTRQPNVLTVVTSGGHRGILSSLMQKAIDVVISEALSRLLSLPRLFCLLLRFWFQPATHARKYEGVRF